MSPRIPAARVHTSEPDQAFRQPPTAWQRDRMGRVQPMRRYYWPMESHGELVPMVDEHGRPWTLRRLVAEALLVFAFAVAFMASYMVLA